MCDNSSEDQFGEGDYLNLSKLKTNLQKEIKQTFLLAVDKTLYFICDFSYDILGIKNILT